MKPGNDISTFECLLLGVGEIWSPAGEALRLQKDLNVHSLEETAAAAERAGCEVCYADLPEKVSGFADIIEGKAHIVLNRAKSRQDLEYTLPHELGHCVLHLNPSRNPSQSGFPEMAMAEFQANLFASTWVNWLGDDRQRKEMLTGNRESSTAIVMSLLFTLVLVAIAIIGWVCSKLFDVPRLTTNELQ
jgi:IrrE N-terminal-like domain